MSEVMFNFHDVILIVTVMQCILFGVLVLLTDTHRKLGTYLLVTFLLVHALAPLFELSLWGSAFKYKVRYDLGDQFFYLSTVYLIDAFLLYLCIKSLTISSFRLNWTLFAHFIPAAIYLIYLWFCFYKHDVSVRNQMVESGEFIYGSAYLTADSIVKSIRVFYCALAIKLVYDYQRHLQRVDSFLARDDLKWLAIMAIGFFISMLIEAILAWAKLGHIQFGTTFNSFVELGLTGYYSSFILINILVFTGVRYFDEIAKTAKNFKLTEDREQTINPLLGEKLEALMLNKRPYQNSELSMGELATMLNMTQKELSALINGIYGVGFYEFINRYRVENAKLMLSDQRYSDKSITDIYLEAGFNSKSVFNTIFKKIECQTPSQYRKQFVAEI